MPRHSAQHGERLAVHFRNAAMTPEVNGLARDAEMCDNRLFPKAVNGGGVRVRWLFHRTQFSRANFLRKMLFGVAR